MDSSPKVIIFFLYKSTLFFGNWVGFDITDSLLAGLTQLRHMGSARVFQLFFGPIIVFKLIFPKICGFIVVIACLASLLISFSGMGRHPCFIA